MEQETAWNDRKFQTLRLLMQEELLAGGAALRRKIKELNIGHAELKSL